MTKQQLGLLVAYIDSALEVQRRGAALMDGGSTTNYDSACRQKTEIFNRLAESIDADRAPTTAEIAAYYAKHHAPKSKPVPSGKTVPA